EESALARMAMATAWTAAGRPALALPQAERAARESQNVSFSALIQVALAQQALGRSGDATKTLAEVTRRASSLGPRERRRTLALQGILAIERGDAAPGIADLMQAEKTLPFVVGGPAGVPLVQHVP